MGPSPPQNVIVPLKIEFSGKSWQDKVKDVIKEMESKNSSLLLLTNLDDIAWLLNLRGSDIPCNPVFFSWVVVKSSSEVHLFVDSNKVTHTVRQHLNLEADIEMREGSSDSNNNVVAILHPYESIDSFLRTEIPLQSKKTWISDKSAYSFCSLLTENLACTDLSPVVLMKALKNSTEIAGMANAHVKDAAALCSFSSWLEAEVAAKKNVTELSASDKLATFRQEQADFMGISFDTISSSGPNAAIMHYKPSVESDRPVNDREIYLCDSGGQYKDGTTDVTRTMHFGTRLCLNASVSRASSKAISAWPLAFSPLKSKVTSSMFWLARLCGMWVSIIFMERGTV